VDSGGVVDVPGGTVVEVDWVSGDAQAPMSKTAEITDIRKICFIVFVCWYIVKRLVMIVNRSNVCTLIISEFW